MLNHIKGENRISDKMEENNRYVYGGPIRIYSSKIAEPLRKNPLMHKKFNINGKFNLDGLEKLTEEGWKREFPRLPEHRTEPEETWVYSSKKAVVILSANYETNYHELDISLKDYSKNNPKNIDDIREIIEKNLECKLNEEGNLSLMDKLESN